MYWVNMQVFDYKGRLVTGDQSLGVWKFPDGQAPTMYPQGTPGLLIRRIPNCNLHTYWEHIQSKLRDALLYVVSKQCIKTVNSEESEHYCS